VVKFNTGEAGARFEAAHLELEQCGSTDTAVDFGTLSIFATKTSFKVKFKVQIICVSYKLLSVLTFSVNIVLKK
jgi:hypothetical protein